MSRKWRIGARWDDISENPRFFIAKDLNLIEFVEVNFPINSADKPELVGLPIYAHTAVNPLCSALGVGSDVAEVVKAGADAADSPWIGEHVSMMGFSATGQLGYVISPLFVQEFADVSIRNAIKLQKYYGRPIALELAPLYSQPKGDFRSELDFLAHIATQADTKIILDLAHWTVSNRNLKRAPDYGLDQLPAERVIELHIAGIRKSPGHDTWHDGHGRTLEPELLDLLKLTLDRFPNVEAVTLEHDGSLPQEEMFESLESIHQVLHGAYV